MNKIYQKYKSKYDEDVKQYGDKTSTYISATDLAILIMDGLKKKYPEYKFAKTSRYFAGGSSVDINLQTGWENLSEEKSKEINKFVDGYSGAAFDGMIDLKYSEKIWLMPDGSVTAADNGGGTSGSVSGYLFPKPSEDAIKICSGAWVMFDAYPKYKTKAYKTYSEYQKQKNQEAA